MGGGDPTRAPIVGKCVSCKRIVGGKNVAMRRLVDELVLVECVPKKQVSSSLSGRKQQRFSGTTAT